MAWNSEFFLLAPFNLREKLEIPITLEKILMLMKMFTFYAIFLVNYKLLKLLL